MSKSNHYEFEDLEISSLYESAKSEQPTADIDATILAASRRAVRSGPKPIAPFSGRWQVPSALAACLVLALLIIPGLFDESMQVVEPPLNKQVPMEALIQTDADNADSVAPVTPGTMRSQPALQEASKQESATARERVSSAPEPASTSGSTHQLEMMSSPAPLPDEEQQVVPLKQVAPSLQRESSSPRPTRQRLDPDPQLVEAWLLEITALKNRGETQEAVRQLRQFLRVYPNVSLPEHLENLLRQ